jgi:hypothetical protein
MIPYNLDIPRLWRTIYESVAATSYTYQRLDLRLRQERLNGFEVFQTCSLFPGDRERKQEQRRRRVGRVKEVRGDHKTCQREKGSPPVYRTSQVPRQKEGRFEKTVSSTLLSRSSLRI